MPAMDTGFDIHQDQRAWVSPSLIEANYILSLSRQELETVVAAEMNANPALEVEDKAICSACGTVMDGMQCPVCQATQRAEREDDREQEHADRLIASRALRDLDDDFDPMTRIATEDTIEEIILRDARTLLEPHEFAIAEYLVDSLDERGLITIDLPELARLSKRPLASIVSVLEVIQDVAPVGVGARNLRECLLLQLDYLERGGMPIPPYVRQIIESHLPEFAAHRYGQIARDLGVSPALIEGVRDFIRVQLNPYPLQSQQAKSWRSPSREGYVAPDVVIALKDEQLLVEVVEIGAFNLRLNPLYEQLAVDISRKKGSIQPISISISESERTHIRQYTNRAKMFLSNIHQRRETLLRISVCICELQEGFLRGGVRELKPLTRAVVAQQVGVHESTVSRATADKYVMLPSRKVIPFSDFFTPSLSVKDVMRELIDREQKNGHILTDRQICDMLMEHGIRIARRTVAKYRAELRILPSTMR